VAGIQDIVTEKRDVTQKSRWVATILET